MRRGLALAAGVLVLVGLGIAGYLFSGPGIPERALEGLEGDATRGTYVARLGNCVACHTDTKGGGALLAGGAAIETPFGTFYPPNITPDPRDGLGAWTLSDFARAMTAGVGPDGRPYYPAFPYSSYALMSDQDIVDLWAVLKSVPAAEGRAPGHRLDFPFDRRFLLTPWQTLFLKPGPFAPDPAHDEIWNRGAYIVRGPGHCGECHTPRNLLGAREESRALAGTAAGPGGDKVPAITRESLRKAGFEESDLVWALQTGVLPDGDALGGSMREVVEFGTSHFTDEDRRAVARYLLSE